MAKLTLADLKNLRDEKRKDMIRRDTDKDVEIIIGMGTCGIAAGAREVMNILMEELAESGRSDIRVIASSCLGMCSSEPNVTIEVDGEEPIVYQLMDANKLCQVFKRHVLLGEVQSDFALAKI